MTNWDKRFLDLAEYISQWSKDRNRKVGAIIVNDKHVISTGYNGFITGSDDESDYKHNRPEKYFYTVHAEANAIYQAVKNGVSVNNCDIYVTLFPCSECCKAIIQSGIKRLITYEPDWNDDRWGESFRYSKEMLTESNILIEYIEKP